MNKKVFNKRRKKMTVKDMTDGIEKGVKKIVKNIKKSF